MITEVEDNDGITKNVKYSVERCRIETTETTNYAEFLQNIQNLFSGEINRINIHEVLEKSIKIIEAGLLIPELNLEKEKVDIESALLVIFEHEEPFEEGELEDIIEKLGFILIHIDITNNSANSINVLVNIYEDIINDEDLMIFLLRLIPYNYSLTEHAVMRLYNRFIETEEIDSLCDLWYILIWYIQDNINNDDTFVNFQLLLSQCIFFLNVVQNIDLQYEQEAVFNDNENIGVALDLLTVIVKTYDSDYTELVNTLLGLSNKRSEYNPLYISIEILKVINNLMAIYGCNIFSDREEEAIKCFKHFIESEVDDIMELLCPIITYLFNNDSDTYSELAHELYETLDESPIDDQQASITLAFRSYFTDIFNSQSSQ